MGRMMLTVSDRVEISTGLKAGWSLRRIAVHVGRSPSVISREVARNSLKSGAYKVVSADCAAERRRRRPQTFKLDRDPVLRARVLADLARSRTPRQIALRLGLEAKGEIVKTMEHSPPAGGQSVSHEGIYRWIYAMPKGQLDAQGILLRSKQIRRKKRPVKGERIARIVGMVSIDDRPEWANDRRVPGVWEGDLIIGKDGKSACATLVERTTRYLTILALPQGKNSEGVADVLIDYITTLPDMLKGSLTWDQGTEMAKHASITVATGLPIYFAHAHSPWERGSNENTNGLIREYLPKGTYITDHQPYLNAIATEINQRPRPTLHGYTPQEALEQLLLDSAPDASTP